MNKIAKTIVCLLLASLTAIALADERPPALPIIDGSAAPATNFPAVANLDGCTGTLIGSRFVLSAAHCFYDMRNRPVTDVTDFSAVINNVSYPAKSVTIHPSYVPRSDACIDGEVDAAIIELQSDVAGVAPIPLLRSAPAAGDSLLLVGFGTLGTGSSGENGRTPAAGIVHFGTTTVERVGSTFVEWTFGQGESNTASGDSGGPAFIDAGGTRFVHSITCGGTGNAGFDTDSFNTRADVIAPWADSIVGTTPPQQPPAFIGSGTLTIGQNQVFNYPVQISGSGPIELTAEGLPDGLSLDGFTISGAPTVAGTFDVALRAANAFGTADGNLTLVVTPFDPGSSLVLTKARVSFDENEDLISLQGTVMVGGKFAPRGKTVRVQIAELEDAFKLNRQGVAQRARGFDFVELRGKLSRGVFKTAKVRFFIGLGDKVDLFNKLDQLFPIEVDGLSPDFRVNLPVEIQIGDVIYRQTIHMRYVARNDTWVSE